MLSIFVVMIDISKIELAILLEIPCEIFFMLTIIVYQMYYALFILFPLGQN